MLTATTGALASLAPSDWQVEIVESFDGGGRIRLVSADHVAAELCALVRERLVPRDVVSLPDPADPTIVASAWLSPRTRELLTDSGYGYVDQTGNVDIVVNRPGIVLRTEGAQRDPSPEPAPRLNLRGPRAWALLRTLAEVLPPYGVSELAAAVDGDPGYVSRLLSVLADELLISRRSRQPIEHVEWKATLRQLASSYALLDSNETTAWVASAGPEQFIADLANDSAGAWAVTGSFAASLLVSVTAPVIAIVYADDPEGIADRTRLREVRSGGNVMVARPYDRIVFERTWTADTITYASPAQIAVDCLTGPGRMPAEGEAVLEWMQRKAPEWQAPSLKAPAKLP